MKRLFLSSILIANTLMIASDYKYEATSIIGIMPQKKV
jgi:hypothetical protein